MTLASLVGIQAFIAPQYFFKSLSAKQSYVEQRRRLASKSAGRQHGAACRSKVTSLNYEVVDSLSLAFEAQLIACAGVVLSGTYFDSQELIAPATQAMVKMNEDKAPLIAEEKEVDIYRYVLLLLSTSFIVCLDIANNSTVAIVTHPLPWCHRDTPLRYAGYLNEVGEAFRPLVPSYLVILSYVLAITYVFSDARSKGLRTDNHPLNRNSGCGAAAVVDTLAFQFVASIIIPGTIINRWVSFCSYITFNFVST